MFLITGGGDAGTERGFLVTMDRTVGKKTLVSRVYVKYHEELPAVTVSKGMVAKLVDLFLQEIFLSVAKGETVTINGFGSFMACTHKGHPIQFGDGGSVDDYLVFKFSPSRALHRKLRKK